MNLDEFLYKNSNIISSDDEEIDESAIREALKSLSEEEFNELLIDLAKSFREGFIDIILEEILDFICDEDF
jgi:hypothetical protein